ACRRARLCRARPADARTSRRGHGRAPGPRPAAQGYWAPPRFVRPVAAAADAGDPRGDRTAAAADADGADGRYQRMADRLRLHQGIEWAPPPRPPPPPLPQPP